MTLLLFSPIVLTTLALPAQETAILEVTEIAAQDRPRFIDYLKVGVPLTLIVLTVLMLILPVFWPLTP